MPKTITSLTDEQKVMLPVWAKKWMDIGLKTGETDWDTFDRYMPACYAAAKLEYPKNVVRVNSPLVGAFAASIAAKMLNAGTDGTDGTDEAVGGAVVVAIGEIVGGAVDEAVDGIVAGEVEGIVDGIVGRAIDGAIAGAVNGIVGRAIDGGIVGRAIDGAIAGAVGEAIKGAKLPWHYWLGGQFWVGGWWGAPSYVSFFTDVCGLELSEDIQERATAYRRICESVNYIWPNRDFVIVCARPKAIHRNVQGRLHNEHGKAIEYPDSWGLYALNGVVFPENLYKKVISREMQVDEILKIENIDQRVQSLKFAKSGIRDFYKKEGGECIDTHVKLDVKGRPIKYELWSVPKGATFTKDVHFMIYNCPSALERGEIREYTKGVPEVKTVAEAMAWGMSSDTHILKPGNWLKLIPLEHEA